METENKKILLVEDDPNFGTVLKDYLAMNDYTVTHAKNGMEGFEKFKKDDFDLCILDVMMPYKDGFTLAKEIRDKNERSEEHTSELQSRENLVCRLLLEKKKTQ